jgi:hypothetical protein
MVAGFGLGGRDVADGSEQAVVVEPVDPAQRRHFDCRSGRPRPLPPDHLGFIEAVDGLSEGVVIRVTDAAYRRHEIGLGQALGVVHNHVLHAPVAVMDQAIVGAGPAGVDHLLKRIEHESRRGAGAGLPANDTARESVDDERDINEPGPGVDVGEVDDPERVRSCDLELAIDLVERAQSLGVAHGRYRSLPAAYPSQPHGPHQALDGAFGNLGSVTPKLVLDLARAAEIKAGSMGAFDMGAEEIIALRPSRPLAGISKAASMGVVE